MGGADWENAFKAAQRTGQANIGGSLLNYPSGELVSLGLPKYRDEVLRGYTAASGNGFVFAARARFLDDGVTVIRYALDGKIQWEGIVRSKLPPPEGLGAFDPVAVSFEDDELHIFGFRHRASGTGVQVRMRVVPLSAMGVGEVSH